MEWGVIFLVGLVWWLWCNAENERHDSRPRKLDPFFWES
jgi:hypothetical protein